VSNRVLVSISDSKSARYLHDAYRFFTLATAHYWSTGKLVFELPSANIILGVGIVLLDIQIVLSGGICRYLISPADRMILFNITRD